MRISDWSSDVCSSDLPSHPEHVVPVLEASRRELDVDVATGHRVAFERVGNADLAGHVIVGEENQAPDAVGARALMASFAAKRCPALHPETIGTASCRERV